MSKEISVNAERLMFELTSRLMVSLTITMLDEYEKMVNEDNRHLFDMKDEPVLTFMGPKKEMNEYVERVVLKVTNTPMAQIVREADPNMINELLSDLPSYDDLKDNEEDD